MTDIHDVIVQRESENVGPTPETVGEALVLNYLWDAALSRLKIPFQINKTIAQDLMALVRIYPADWRK